MLMVEHGGGLTGGTGGYGNPGIVATGGTQTSGGSGWIAGSFGIGGGTTSTSYNDGGSGGGGYYGGGRANGANYAGGGGSGFVTGYTGCDTTYRNNHKGINNELLNFTDVVMQNGVKTGNGSA